MFGKKRILFAYPEAGMQKFDDIFQQTCRQPLAGQKDSLTIKASCTYNHMTVDLAVHSHVLQQGNKNAPIIVYLPWYGGKSTQSREYFGTKWHPDWMHIGIDIFNTTEEFEHVLASAVVSQYAYALIIRMMAEQVRLARAAGRRVGMLGISYGANVLSAYTTRDLETPDAIVAVEGGSILQTTLKGRYQGRDCDRRTLEAIQQEPELIPIQKPVSGTAAAISAAVINRDDKIVIGQEYLWENAAAKMYIRGGHLLGPRLYQRKIRNFVKGHLEQLLATHRL